MSYIIIAVLPFCSALLQQVLQLQFQVSLLRLNEGSITWIFTSIKIYCIVTEQILCLFRNFKWHLDLYKNKNALSVPGGSGPRGDGIGGSKGAARDTRSSLGVQIFSFSCSFWQKIDKIIPIWELAHPPLENPGSATGWLSIPLWTEWLTTSFADGNKYKILRKLKNWDRDIWNLVN